MVALNSRVARLEKTLEPDLTGNPFTLPEAWEAYGLLLENGVRQHAAKLYTNGRIDELKQLWIDLAKQAPNRTQPTKRQLSWAVDRMPHMIERWKEDPNWPAPGSPYSQFAEWFQKLHRAVNQVAEWHNPPIEQRQSYWVITIDHWAYWCKTINLVNGREILQTEYDTPAAAAAAFQLGTSLVNQAYDNVISGRN